ncbi:hypothetical protein Tco_0445287 [Tanacetum coccineum]
MLGDRLPPPRPKWFICPVTEYRIKQIAYRGRVPIVTSLVQVKEKPPERVHDVESEEDLKEDSKEEDSELPCSQTYLRLTISPNVLSSNP